MILSANMNWIPNQGIQLPVVMADVNVTADYFEVSFTVEEPEECFRSEVREDNGRSWEDSCVEIFLQNPAKSEEYFNFETTSRGFLLAAHGPDRNNRQVLSQNIIDKIIRTKQVASVAGNLICWGMTVQIPASIFGLSSFEGFSLRGNLYKCGDKSRTPHYLSAFPIETEKPDFHRPEFFQEF
ncbi:cellulose/xylan binding protein with CBM9 domain [Fibrobacter sp. UWR4]|uniref:carbohydrate-binding family 9-like protein n=2 Tax=unclassified Fibrobacter TaxID=2634177 RepID=UPI000D6A894D|nr:carbohydrate-binding family 9-like protein [Fibrobacter sp. UWR4]PWJ62729.1 cellulose/xylan binding protein with CBM9 domain [Fibrobacter sp. UWR4]PZW66831.1 cellulose/xylan binding protein with CBM9 domain [Fibrobacter sp. UWR1]